MGSVSTSFSFWAARGDDIFNQIMRNVRRQGSSWARGFKIRAGGAFCSGAGARKARATSEVLGPNVEGSGLKTWGLGEWM